MRGWLERSRDQSPELLAVVEPIFCEARKISTEKPGVAEPYREMELSLVMASELETPESDEMEEMTGAAMGPTLRVTDAEDWDQFWRATKPVMGFWLAGVGLARMR